MASFLTHQRLPAGAIRIADPAREARLALAFCALAIVASALTGLVERAWLLPLWGAVKLTSDATYVLGFKLGVLLGVPVVWLVRAGYTLDDLLLGWRATPRSLLVLVALFFAGALLNAGKLAPIGAAARDFPPAEAAARLLVGSFVVLVSAGLPEELAFRWGVHTRLERAWGRLPALVVTAALFTAWHLPTRYLLAPGGAEGRAGDAASVLLGTGLPVFVVALGLGWAWDRWRNLPALIVFHWGVDTLPSIASFLKVPIGTH